MKENKKERCCFETKRNSQYAFKYFFGLTINVFITRSDTKNEISLTIKTKPDEFFLDRRRRKISKFKRK
jgi:hypothetical protein